MQHRVDRLRQFQSSNFAMTRGRAAAQVMLDANSRHGGRPRGRRRVQERSPGRQLLGIARSEPGIGRARVPELGAAEKGNSTKRPELGRI